MCSSICDGGYAEHTLADARYCLELPSSLDDRHAAPLLCAGLVGYRSLTMTEDARRIGIHPAGDGLVRAARRYISDTELAAALMSLGISVMVASVNSRTLATDTAFSNATRTTFVGSTMPASNRST